MSEEAVKRGEIVAFARKWLNAIDDVVYICEMLLKIASWTVMAAAIEFASVKVGSAVLRWGFLFCQRGYRHLCGS